MSSTPTIEAKEPPLNLADLYAPIASGLVEAERIFQLELGSRFPFVQQLVDHCADFHGKRLRPALVLLTGRGSSAHRHRSATATSDSTSSTWAPHPRKVGRLHAGHSTRLHIPPRVSTMPDSAPPPGP